MKQKRFFPLKVFILLGALLIFGYYGRALVVPNSARDLAVEYTPWTSYASPALTEILTVTPTEPLVNEDPLAFPGATGFGSETPGGRFGRIIIVSNLHDTTDEGDPAYVGSLRWAVEHTWLDDPNDPYDHRRIIIFKVSGLIDLVEVLYITNPYVTIAGQTAPGGGLILRGAQVTIATHDVILRGLRFRVGDQGVPTCCRDGLNISTSEADSDVYNIVVDHNSFSWAIDENVSIYQDNERPFTIHDITIQWNIISEGLYNSIHVDEGATGTDPHSMGMILGAGGYNVTVHHNLFAHNWGRNPRVAGVINSEILNNVIYAWGDAALEFGQDKSLTHVINNFFKATDESRPVEIKLSSAMHPESMVYLRGNVSDDARESASLISVRFKDADGFTFAEAPVFHWLTPVELPEMAFEAVLQNAGAIAPARDGVDIRIVNQVVTRTGIIIDSQDQVGGWPDLAGGEYPADQDNDGLPDAWEILHGLNPNDASDASNFKYPAPSGFSWIEVYINSLIPMLGHQ